MLETVLWIVVGFVVVWVWLFFGSRRRCPACGLELTDNVLEGTREYRYNTLDHCRRCGWKRRT